MRVFSKLDRVMRKFALSLGVTAAIAVPAGFGLADYYGRMNLLEYQVEMAAERIAVHARASSGAWHDSQEQLAKLTDVSARGTQPLLASFGDKNGQTLFTIGPIIERPGLTARAPIIVGDEIIGHVALTTSAWPYLARLQGFMLLGAMLGFLVYGCVHHLPSRALRRVLDDWIQTQKNLREQVNKTSKALALAEAEQHRAERASRAKSEFLANMSHELRTPLNAIIGFSDLMKSKLHGPLNADYDDYAAHINECGQSLLRIVNDILDIAKIDAGRLQTIVETLDAARLVKDCIDLLRPQAEEAQLTLSFDQPAQMDCQVIADMRRLKHAFFHLASNAVKFTPQGGRIMIKVDACEPGMIDIVIHDTGIGMTADQIAAAFQPFSQADSSLARKYEGTGLGLVLAKRLTELQGGQLLFESAMGLGTKATLRLPAADSAQIHALHRERPRYRPVMLDKMQRVHHG